MEDNTNFVLQSGGTTPLGGPKPEKTKSRFSAIGPKLGLAALFIIAIVLASHFVSKVQSGQTSGNASDQHETAGKSVPQVVVKTDLTLSDSEWSQPPVTIELCQGIGSFIVQGEAEKYMVRDAAHPETNYSWTNGQVICFDGNPINNRQWMVKGIRRGPVVLRYHIYE